MLATQSILAWVVIGAIAGWLAGVLVKGYGYGLIRNIVIGILGAGVAGLLAPSLGVHTESFGGNIVASLLGALVLLCLVCLVRRTYCQQNDTRAQLDVGAAPGVWRRTFKRCPLVERIAARIARREGGSAPDGSRAPLRVGIFRQAPERGAGADTRFRCAGARRVRGDLAAALTPIEFQ